MTAFAAQNHSSAVFTRGEFYVRTTSRADQPQEYGFRIADAAIWHFQVRLRRENLELNARASMIVDQFERATAKHRRRSLCIVGLRPHNLQREEADVQNEKTQEDAV